MISIIIPAHNIENYLPKCIDSILSQSYGDFEVLIMENGSSDNTYGVAEDYSMKDERVKVVKLSTKGVSNARNAGLDMAQGRFIMFVDGDDFVSSDYIKCAVDAMTDNVELVNLPYYQYNSESNIKPHDYKCDTGIYTGDGVLKFFSLRNVWARLYRSEIINNNNIRFSPTLSFGEDFLFALEYLSYTNTAVLVDNGHYFYRHNREGQATAHAADYSNVDQMLQSMSLIEQMFVANNSIDRFRRHLDREYAHLLLGFSFAATHFRKLTPSDVRKLLEPHRERILSIKLDESIAQKWLYKWWSRFIFCFKHNKYSYFFKFIRYYRNFVLQPLHIKYR